MDDEYDIGQDQPGVRPPCPFMQPILARCCNCRLAVRCCVSERDSVVCVSASARRTCASLRELLVRNARFALKLGAGQPLTHAKTMQALGGGLVGLRRLIHGMDEIGDVHGLVHAALHRFGTLDRLPYSQVMPAMVGFAWRQRRP